MAATRKYCRLLAVLFSCVVIFLTTGVRSLVHEVNSQNLDKFLSGKLFTLTFVDSPSCTRCRTLFPFFVQASQVFPNDPEIFFARTHDRKLQEKWGVTELPSLMFHMHGLGNHQYLDLDVTVDDIVDMIARLLHGNFAGLSRTYSVHVTPENFQEMIITPRQHVLLLLNDKKDTEERTNLDRVAYAFRKDDAILFASLDVSKYEKLRNERFKSRETPVLMWFQADEKDTPKRFGGVLSAELITMFVNERTGLNRDTEGGILQEAGRIPAADKLLNQYIEDVVDHVDERLVSLSSALTALKPSLEEYENEMLDYYLFVLDNIAMAGNVAILRELIRGEEEKLSEKEELSTKQRETLKRRKNVLTYMQSLVNEVKESRKKRKDDTKRKQQEETLILENPSKHDHVHTEL
ncbi:protein disulfide-isomerase like 2-1 [Aplysia californica]|uniref:Protein disulfide-isomerase like 2-1 n=1 Tax=Aplysia californica TaxID=6500 RepID=A0ABM0JK78_APLCA|nr:protein disulfide-isomerase like 2-1 [Aplysia californica]